MNIATKTIFIFEFISLQLCYGLLRYREKKIPLSNSVFVFCKHLSEFITQLKQGQKTEQAKYLSQMLFRAV